MRPFPCRWCFSAGGWRAALLFAFVCLGLAKTHPAPWDGFGRSFPNPRYEQDAGANFYYRFGVNKAFTPYRDPDIAEAKRLPNPLRDPAFDSYRLIVIVNKKDDAFWGRGQTLRVYQREKGLLYSWLVSTGAKGYEMPSGYFVPQGFSSRHWSGPYDAPMLWSVFFNGESRYIPPWIGRHCATWARRRLARLRADRRASRRGVVSPH